MSEAQADSAQNGSTPVDLLDKFAAIDAARAEMASHGEDPTRVVLDGLISPTEARSQGRRLLLAGTNNYLGLTFHPDCVAAGQDALARFGTGTTGSRMANGNYTGHEALERAFAEFYDLPHAMLFSTGYAANLGVLNALVGPDDAVLLDADAHASLYDGCKLAGVPVYRFKHNDPASLDKRLKRLGDRARRALVVVEGLYSILGDSAPLAEIAQIKAQHGAYLFVDEAHSLGIYGAHGRGVVESAGIENQVDFVVGTFSKSLGATGGYCVSPHAITDLLRYASRPYIFTASLCPSVVATVHAALDVIRADDSHRKSLWRNARALYEGLAAAGFALGPECSPVVAVRHPDRGAVIQAWQALLGAGVYVNLIVPPASPDGGSLLRLSVSAAHTPAQIDELLQAFETHCQALRPAR
ncbi:MAG: aminotransferase class I/II-fold pyridoxal phosphate-dependent enzyme [Pseudomonadota bacterium]